MSRSTPEVNPIIQVFKQSLGIEAFKAELSNSDTSRTEPVTRYSVASLALCGSIIFPATSRKIEDKEASLEDAIFTAATMDMPNLALTTTFLVTLLYCVPRYMVNDVGGLDLSLPFAVSALSGAKLASNMITHSLLNIKAQANQRFS